MTERNPREGIREELRQKIMEQLQECSRMEDDELYEQIDRAIREKGQELFLPLKERLWLRSSLYDSFRRLDILQELLDDRNVTEIMVNGAGKIFIERKDGTALWERRFERPEQLEDIIQQIVGRVNRVVNVSSPIADARLEDGSRVHIVLPPVALDGPVVTIRKFPEPITMEKLIGFGAVTEEAAQFLEGLVAARYNIFVSGGTNSGKTTFLNALSSFIPRTDRVITIEDSAELQISQVPNLVRLETRDANTEGKGQITISQLIRASLRMNPEPIIAGSSYPMSFSSFPGRGSLKGQRAIRRWIESGKGIRNFAQADIRHFYSHIQYKIVRKKLERRVKDSFFLHLIDVCMTYFPKEMPLGFYLSQWLANFMLQELDYDIKCKLKIAHHVRYMDNYTLADDNKKKLHQALLYIRQALGKMRLRMKNDWQVFRFEYTKKNGKKTGRCVSAMGWLFYRSKVLIRKHILLHVERIARKLHKKEENGQRFPLGLCRGFVSLLGWITHSETYDWYLIHIKELVNVRKIKRIISKMTREVNRHAGMEKGTLQRAA